jgi:N-carbamoylputrescine amidase
MQSSKVALIQTIWNGSRDAMKTQIREMASQAVGEGATLICLPEFSILPYFPGTTDKSGFDWAEALPGGESERFFAELATSLAVTVIGSLYEKTRDGNYFDTATIHGPEGKLIGQTRKIHIPSGVGYHETHFFGGSDEYPVFDIGALRMATPTCYDQWFPELARIYSMNGAQFIFYPTAIGSEPTDPDMDSREQWQTIMRGHAIANGVFIGAANRVGTENLVTFYGSSFICDPMGNIIAQAGRDQPEVVLAEIDLSVLRRWRGLFPLLHQRHPNAYARLLDDDVADDAPEWL